METEGRAQRRHGRLTRAEITDLLGLTRSTVSVVLAGLLEEGAVVVIERGPGERGWGRPAEVLSLDPVAAQHVGIEFAHHRVEVVAVNPSLEVIASATRSYPHQTDWQRRCELAVELLDALDESGVPAPEVGVADAATAGGTLHFQRLQGVGVGLPGPNSAVWGDLPVGPSTAAVISDRVGRHFEERFGAPVLVDHHLRFAAMAESAWGQERAAVDDLLYLRLSQGCGGSLVNAGVVARGAHARAGELGHVFVERGPGAAPCRCGRRGCLEALVLVGAVLDRASRHDPALRTVDDLAAARHRPWFGPLLDEVPTAVGTVLGMAVVMLDPGEVVLSGEVTRLHPTFVERVATALRDEVLPGTEPPLVRLARLDRAGALGGVVAQLDGSRFGHGTGSSEEYPR